MSERWTSEEIIRFLDVYQRYDVLWNTQLNGHRDKTAREHALANLMADLNMEGLTFDFIRNKIKMIKTVYNQERNKILKSSLTAIDSSEVYKPKLAWFEKADSFLKDVCSSRTSTFKREHEEDYIDHDYENTHKRLNFSTSPLKKLKTRKILLETSKERIEKEEEEVKTPNQFPASPASSLTTAKVVEQNKKLDDEFDYFGKYIAAQLRHLPEINALHCQEQILGIITQERIAYLHEQADIDSEEIE